MSVFATIATVCTLAICSDYVLDTAPVDRTAAVNTSVIDDHFLSIWGDEKELNKWLDKYKIGETVFEIVSIEFNTKEIEEDDLP